MNSGVPWFTIQCGTNKKLLVRNSSKFLDTNCDIVAVNISGRCENIGDTYERNVTHGVDDNALVLLSVLCNTTETRLHYVIAVQELLLGRRLYPHFELKTTTTTLPDITITTTTTLP